MSLTPTSDTPLVSIDRLYLSRHNIRQAAEKLANNPVLASQINEVGILPDAVSAPRLPSILAACVGMSHLTFESVSLGSILPLVVALWSVRISRKPGPGASTHGDLRPLSRVTMLELRSCIIDEIRPLMMLVSLCPALQTLELIGCEVGETETGAFTGPVPRLRKLIIRVTSGLSRHETSTESDTLKMLLPLAERVEVRVGAVCDVVLSAKALLAPGDGSGGVNDLRIDGTSWEGRSNLRSWMLEFCPALRTLNLRSLTLAGMPLAGPAAPATDWVVPLLEATPSNFLEQVQIEVIVDCPGYAPRINTVNWGRVDSVLESNARRLRQVSVVLVHSLVDNAELRTQVEREMAVLAAAIKRALPNLSAQRAIVTFTMVFRDATL